MCHAPSGPRRITFAFGSQALKSPTTDTARASGAVQKKFTGFDIFFAEYRSDEAIVYNLLLSMTLGGKTYVRLAFISGCSTSFYREQRTSTAARDFWQSAGTVFTQAGFPVESRAARDSLISSRPMNLTPDSPSPTPLSPGQREALFRLLDDEDPGVSGFAKQRLISEGQGVIPWLKPHILSNNPVLRRRAREILIHFEALDADERMRSFCRRAGEDLDLEEGCLRLAQTRFPELNMDAYKAILDDWSTRVAEWLPEDRHAADDVLGAMHMVLFQQIGLRGNETNYYEPENSYLNCVVDRRLGNPIALCTLVLLVGRRLGLPLVGIGLPAHFLCRYQSPTTQVYMDAFHGGRLLNRTDCIAFVNKLGRPFEESFLQPVSPRRMLQRMCINLEHAYENLEMRPDLTRIRTYHGLLNGV